MNKLKVTGMSCGHCENAVSKALASVPGVVRVVEVNRKKEIAIVEGNTDIQALIAAVQKIGYTAQAIE